MIGLSLVGADLVEVSPSFDHTEIISLAAASLLRDMICVHKINLGR
ncbi:MAG: arginase family protein [Alphaproteobacteria bacterium]|nr:arginase family protein [Alphaproteobacteria bacterium]